MFPPHYAAPLLKSGDLHGYGVPRDGNLHGDGVPCADGGTLPDCDGDFWPGDGSPPGPTPLTRQHATDNANPVLGYGGRLISRPFQDRDDAGEIGILNGNFGPERNDRRMREYTRENLKKSPATIIALQEAEDGVYGILTAAPQLAAAAPAVAGQAAAAPVDQQGGRRRTLADRPEAQFLAVMGVETGGQSPTLLTAVRSSMALTIRTLQWYWHLDGRYRKNGERKPARTRVLISEINWRRPTAQMTKLVHANVHLHHMTAKKAAGLAQAHTTFFQNLYQMLVESQVKIMSGDFNMSVFQVVSILRSMGLTIDLGAIYPWRKVDQPNERCDSCAIFLIGGCQKINLKFSLLTFTQVAANAAAAVAAPTDADANAAAQTQGSNHGCGSDHELAVFQEGQGYPLTSYLPPNRRQFAHVLREMFTFSSDIDQRLLSAPDLLPKWKQKLVDLDLFDPNDRFFRSGAHMALLGYLGNVPSRSDTALMFREKRNREKLKEKREGRKNATEENENEGAPTGPVTGPVTPATSSDDRFGSIGTLHSV